MVTFALGTLLAPVAGDSFDHVPAAALAFGGFLLAWRRRPGAAGLLCGAALLVEYESALILAVLACYLALQGVRSVRAYLVGLAPGVLLLGAYDWAAFRRPWHLSYRYVDNTWSTVQSKGFFGVAVPSRFGIDQVFAGSSGLLVVSPVLVLAAFGLARLGRTHRPEALVAASVTTGFVLINCGYFDPYGGWSPGPRFLVASLPFLALGLGPAFTWRPRLTACLAVVSVISTTALTLTWGGGPESGGTWGALARVPVKLGSAPFVRKLGTNVLGELGPGLVWSAALVALCAVGALAVGIRSMPWAEIRARRREANGARTSSLRAIGIAAVVAYFVLVANVFALTDYPYGARPQIQRAKLQTSISASSSVSRPGGDVVFRAPGGEVDFRIDVTNRSAFEASGVHLKIELAPGMQLLGRPAFTRGSGCIGSSTLTCNLDFLDPNAAQTATVWFGVRITQMGNQTVTASSTGEHNPRSNVASLTVFVSP
jgi:hypothetical protein